MYLTQTELTTLQGLAQQDPALHNLAEKLEREELRRKKQIRRTMARQRTLRASAELSQRWRSHPHWILKIVEDEAQGTGYLKLEPPADDPQTDEPYVSRWVLPLDLAQKLYDQLNSEAPMSKPEEVAHEATA